MTNAVSLAQQASTGVSQGFKNRIINGAMVIDQRNAGASVTNLAGALTYSVDRWPVNCSAASKFTMQQNAGSVTPPAGFSNYLGLTSTSAYTSGSTDYFHLYQPVEGYNIADLNWGTANAKTVTFSFWVRASVTGTYGGIIINSAGTANYPFTYTVSSANTWEYKTLTVVGPTIGAWNSTNGTGLEFRFDLGSGSSFTTGTAGAWSASFGYPSGTVKFVATNGGTLYLTGVQLEVGSTATSFDYRPYGTELQLCQRYYYRIGSGNQYIRIGTGPAGSSTIGNITIFMQTPMRSAPTSVTQTGSVALWSGATVFPVTSIAIETSSASPITVSLSPGVASGLTAEKTYQLIGNNDATAAIALSAEL